MFRHFLDAWNEPAMRHAMFVHFPIVLSLAGVPVLLAAALLKRWRAAAGWTAIAIYAVVAGTALVARSSGLASHDAIRGSLDDQGQALLEEHESLGIWVWVIAASIAALCGAGLLKPAPLRVTAAWTAVAAGLFASWFIAVTAEHGGRLVYRFGAGTPDDLAQVMESLSQSSLPTDDPRVAFFRDQVSPILLEDCLRCHNPRRAERSGGLDQTTIAGLLRGGGRGPAVVPGKPQESLLIRAVRWEDPDLQMPLGEDRLTDEQIAALEKWIADGAVWEPFQYAPAR